MKLYKPIIFLCASVALFCGSSRCVPSDASGDLGQKPPMMTPDTQEQLPYAKQPTIELPKSLKPYLERLKSDAPNCIITCDGKAFNVNVGRYPTIYTFDQWLKYIKEYLTKSAKNKDLNILMIIRYSVQFARNNIGDFDEHKDTIWSLVSIASDECNPLHEPIIKLLSHSHGLEIKEYNNLLQELLLSFRSVLSKYPIKDIIKYRECVLNLREHQDKYKESRKSAIECNLQLTKLNNEKRRRICRQYLEAIKQNILGFHLGIWPSIIQKDECAKKDNQYELTISYVQDFINVIDFLIKNIIVCTHEAPTIEINRETFEFKLTSEKIDIAVKYALQSLKSLHELISCFICPEYAREKICMQLEKAYDITFVEKPSATLSPDSLAPQIS